MSVLFEISLKVGGGERVVLGERFLSLRFTVIPFSRAFTFLSKWFWREDFGNGCLVLWKFFTICYLCEAGMLNKFQKTLKNAGATLPIQRFRCLDNRSFVGILIYNI